MTQPLIGVAACRRMLAPHDFHVVGHKYLRAVVDAAQAQPLIIAALGDDLDLAAILARLDGLLLTGSPSDVEPARYNGGLSTPGALHDPCRDATTLPLIRAAVDAHVPVLAICRGMQELNVAYGGTLYQRVHEQPGFDDHREDKTQPLDAQYGPAHAVRLLPGGILRRIAGAERIEVNSLHGQGIDRLGDGLIAEAEADDGLVEAVRVGEAATFAIGVQWHPEWRVMEAPFQRAIFREFGDAARARAAERP